MTIDAHNHFWVFDPVRDSWITEDMLAIRRDFLPQDFKSILDQNGIQGTVAVQADQSLAETLFLLQLASEYDWIKGVVGWVDFQSDDVFAQIQQFIDEPKLKGFRHIAQAEGNDFLVSPPFLQGIAALNKTDYTYDILIYPPQLPAAIKLVRQFPAQKFVLDHIAKPYIKEGKLKSWKADIKALAKYENVYGKISGMITEADWKTWTEEDLIPYIDVVVEAFGTDRLMYGSDFPVCLVAASYGQVLGIVEKYFSTFSEDEQDKIFGLNAIEFYNL